MDPNATAQRIADLLRNAPGDDAIGLELDLACQDLYDWLAKGGFAPTWPPGSAQGYYACRAVVHRRGERVEREG